MTKGLFSDSDLDSDSEPTNRKSAQTRKVKNQKHDTAALLDSDADTDIEITPQITPTSNTKKTEQFPHTNQMATSNTNQILQTTNQNNTQNTHIHTHTYKHIHTHTHTHTHIHTHTRTH